MSAHITCTHMHMTDARIRYVERWCRTRLSYGRDVAVTALRMIARDGSVTSNQLAAATGKSRQYAHRILRLMMRAGLLQRSHDRGRGVRYTITPSDPPHYRAERAARAARKNESKLLTTKQEDSLKRNTAIGGSDKSLPKRKCKRVWEAEVQLRRGRCKVWQRGPWIRDIALLVRWQLRSYTRNVQQMVASIIVRTVRAYRLTVERALQLVHTIITHIRRTGRHSLRRVTWWTRVWLVGSKKRARQRNAHLAAKKGNPMQVVVEAVTQSQQSQMQPHPMQPPRNIDTSLEALLRPHEVARYRELERKVKQHGYECLTRVEKRDWNDLNRLYAQLKVSIECQDGLAAARMRHAYATNPAMQLSAALPAELRSALKDAIQKMASRINTVKTSVYTSDDGVTYYL
ncbi:MAG: winged helix-turn-helix domain-containing protein [Candidatus Caldarchaeum sp.]